MSQRERRSNAGNRMAKLLDEEEEDDFYKTTYGGFLEADEDNDYVYVLTVILRFSRSSISFHNQ